LYRPQLAETTKALKNKQNNLNYYACGRVNALAGIYAALEAKY
jgi:hypothetical protein